MELRKPRKVRRAIASPGDRDIRSVLSAPLPLSRTDLAQHEQIALKVEQVLNEPLSEQEGQSIMCSFGSHR